ncbi:MAG: SDR family oxidoreductase [Deltaproteobacteria bacterium]|nr:SDR family oxidoreductase [Deltaproteobacteria bacterium]MBW1847035.1 SDR family oxidoreductase [Deltaproteobacteria bacterium]MBW1985319.1 SDR family oxidoreductase [Deltaproteobacteria bacterium]MBW2363713.1 SDR family oxidoreductase [Deltaproteobacteria bacterium]
MENMLDNRVCIITGSGRGIGREAALMFASEGGKIVVSDLDKAPAEETVNEIKSRGGEAVAVVGDITGENFPEKIIDTAIESFSGIDVIVNNAGYTWDSVIQKMTDEQWDKILALHCTAPFKILRAAAPFIRESAKKEKEEGKQVMRKVVNVSSVAGTNGNAGQVNYSTAKAGLMGMTKTLAKEWGRYNVNVNCVAYSWIETRLTDEKEKGGQIEIAGQKIEVGIPKLNQEMIKKGIPLGRPGTVNEAARAIFIFASPLSDWISGQILKVDGGKG